MSRQQKPSILPITTGNSGYSNLDTGARSPATSSSSHQAARQQGGDYYDSRNPYDSPRTAAGYSANTNADVDQRGTAGVATGAVGGGFGPYSYDPSANGRVPRPNRDSSLATPQNHFAGGNPNRYSARTTAGPSPFAPSALSAPPSSSGHSSPSRGHVGVAVGAGAGSAGLKPAPMWTAKDAAMDDKLHNSSPHDAMRDRSSCTPWSLRGWLNMTALFVLVASLVTLFAGYPIIDFYRKKTMSTYGAYGIGGINATGQVPEIPGLPTLIDKATPASALTRTGYDGKKYVLQFSDEFETDGRTFWPGDDPFWEAVDLHYWQTGDYEWYDPDAITTKDGNLVITVTEEPWKDLNFRSGMLQSWNKFCFTGGYIEISIQLPGEHGVSGFWPGAWTMGNLGRAGYGASTHGLWPYSYNSCDVGTLPNQTNVAGTGPAAALNTGPRQGMLNQLPGQRTSACTCPGAGKEHPGPDVSVGRGAPEIDIIEAQVSWKDGAFVGSVSQTAQIAPYDAAYYPRNSTPYTVIYDEDQTYLNEYVGGPLQQACSGVTYTDPTAYALDGAGFSAYGFEYWPDTTNGYVTFVSSGKAAWTLNAAAIGPNAETQVGQRLISQEPMYIIINMGISSSFQTIRWDALQFPGVMLVDYVRVYQIEGEENLGCSPPSHPTADYIQDHLNAYMNANYTTWDQAGYEFPKNSMQGC